MATTHIFSLILVFCAVAGASVAAVGWFMPRPIQTRLKQAVGEAPAEQENSQSAWREKIVSALSPAGKLTVPKEGWENSLLRQRFMQAGIRKDQAVLFFFAAKTLLTFALPIVFMLAAGLGSVSVSLNGAMVAILGLAAVGYYAPNIWLGRRIAFRQREMFEALPDAIDLMTVMVEAGLGLDAAIVRVGQELGPRSPILEEELRLVGLELRAGASREQALTNLARRSGVEELDLLVAVLVQTDRFGTSMAESLRVHSDTLRTKRRLRAEEAAAKIALKLLFPLIFCIFPSVMIVLMGPAVISIYRVFIPIVGGMS